MPVADVQALLLAGIKVSENNARQLALQRGVAIKNHLQTAQLPPQRLFPGQAKPGDSSDWQTHAQLKRQANRSTRPCSA